MRFFEHGVRGVGRLIAASAAVLALTAVLVSPASAEVVTPSSVTDAAGSHVADGNFASPAAPAGSFTSYSGGQTIGGAWSVLGSGVNLGSAGYFPPPVGDPAGTQSVDLTGDGLNTALTDGIAQAIPTVAGQTYTVHFQMSGNAAGPPVSKTMTVSATGNAVQAYTFPGGNSSTSSAAMNWQPESYTFTATGSSTALSFVSTTSGSPYGPLVTDIQVPKIVETEQPIPTIAPCGTGTLTLPVQSDQQWTSDTFLPAGATFATDDGNTQVSPTEVKGGPFAPPSGSADYLVYQVTVDCSATPGSTLIATTPSTFTTADGTTASIHVRINVANVLPTPLVDGKVAGGVLGAAGLLLAGGFVAYRRRQTAAA